MAATPIGTFATGGCLPMGRFGPGYRGTHGDNPGAVPAWHHFGPQSRRDMGGAIGTIGDSRSSAIQWIRLSSAVSSAELSPLRPMAGTHGPPA